jgi:hypothetical protein
MTDRVSQVYQLSSTEEALVNTIKKILSENAVGSTPFSWGHRYENEQLKNATNKLKDEISKRHEVSLEEVIIIYGVADIRRLMVLQFQDSIRA